MSRNWKEVEGANRVSLKGEDVSKQGPSRCKDPEAEEGLACFETSQEARVAGEGWEGKTGSNEVREMGRGQVMQ